MDTSIDFSHTTDTRDNERVLLASPQVALRHISLGSWRQIERSGPDLTDAVDCACLICLLQSGGIVV